MLCRHCGDTLEVAQLDIDRPDRACGYCVSCDVVSLLIDNVSVEVNHAAVTVQARAAFEFQGGRAKATARPPKGTGGAIHGTQETVGPGTVRE